VLKIRHRQYSIFLSKAPSTTTNSHQIHIKRRRTDAAGARLHEPYSRRQSKPHPRPQPRLCREYRQYLYRVNAL